MVFVAEKIKQTNKFNLDGLGAKRAVKRSPGLRPWQKIAVASLCGAILALSVPGFDQWWLAWFMVAPILVLVSFCHRNLEPLLVGFSFAVTYHLISLHYYLSITGATKQVAVIVWILQAFMLSLPTAVFAWSMSFLPLRPGYVPYLRRPFFAYLIAMPLLWVFLHWGLAMTKPLSSLWRFAPFPPLATDALVYSQYNLLPILQLLKYIGPSGLEFLLLMVNGAIAACIVEFIKTNEGPVERVDAISPKAGALLDLAIAVTLTLCLFSFGQTRLDDSIKQSKQFLQYDKSDEHSQPQLPIGIVANQREDLFLNKQFKIIVFPEAEHEVSPAQLRSMVNHLTDGLGESNNVIFTSFASSDKESIMRQNLILSADKTENIKQSIYYAAGLVILNDMLSKNAGVQKPTLSLATLPTFLQEWLFRLGKDDQSSWYALNMPKINWGKVGLLSGADIADFRLVADEVRRGASLIVSSVNVSWIANRFLNKQLLAAAIFRAAENNRYIILGANGGTLALIEPDGNVQGIFLPSSQSPDKQSKKADLLLGTVQFLWSKTVFTRTRWL
jgi:apolipoprotein N-acyltransferase